MLSARGPTVSLAPDSVPPFAEHLRTVLAKLRGALLDLLVASGGDPSRPQQVARHLGLDKTLAWKVARLATATDPILSLPLVPGESGIEILLRAATKVAAASAAIANVREAWSEFEHLVQLHAEDRATLEMMATELLPATERAERDEAARRLAFQGNSAILGVRAKARLATYFVARSASDPARLDLGFIGGLIGFRRLRMESRTPIFQRQLYHDDGTPLAPVGHPIFPAPDEAQGVPLLCDFCKPLVPPLRAVPTQNGAVYELTEGPVGRIHSADCVYGMHQPDAASCFRDEVDRFGEHPTRLFSPVESLQVDLLIDRTLGFRMPPEASLHSMLTVRAGAPQDRERDRLPLFDAPRHLGVGLAKLESELMPRYTEMLGTAIAKLGWSADRFDCWRLTVRYPPIPSLVVLRYPLLDRPD